GRTNRAHKRCDAPLCVKRSERGIMRSLYLANIPLVILLFGLAFVDKLPQGMFAHGDHVFENMVWVGLVAFGVGLWFITFALFFIAQGLDQLINFYQHPTIDDKIQKIDDKLEDAVNELRDIYAELRGPRR